MAVNRTHKSAAGRVVMLSEETPMQLEEKRHAAVVVKEENDIEGEDRGEAVENSNSDGAAQAREREQTRQMMAEMLGLERVAMGDDDAATRASTEDEEEGKEVDYHATSGAKLWNKDQHIAMVADALAKELTAFREQNGLEGTPEELAHLNQFLAIDYEVLKPHMRRAS